MRFHNELDTLVHMKDMLALLLVLNDTGMEDNSIFPDENVKNYFFEEFFLRITKNLIFYKFFRHNEVLQMSNRILEEVLKLVAKYIDSDFTRMSDVFSIILDLKRKYFIDNDNVDKNFNMLQNFPVTEALKEW